MKKRFGFTLIELLVVIAIIGGLSAMALPNFMDARQRARDTQRKSDLKQIQKAFELYKQDQNPPVYPALSPPPITPFVNSVTSSTYMNKFPADPQSPANPTPYFYQRDATDSLKYTLCACLENKADADGINAATCGTNYTCMSGRKFVVTEP